MADGFQFAFGFGFKYKSHILPYKKGLRPLNPKPLRVGLQRLQGSRFTGELASVDSGFRVQGRAAWIHCPTEKSCSKVR